VHQIKVWMAQRCYHARIEKKWRKRFGVVKFSPTAYFARHPFTGGTVIYMHPLLIEELTNSTQPAEWSPEFRAKLESLAK